MPVMKRAIKDSVFTFLFKQPEYTRQLYLVLHPEDTSVTEEECKIVTLEHVLTVGLYNDLGIQVRDKLIILVEAQSTFSENSPLRMLLYLSNTYFEHVKEQKLDLYGSRPVKIPRPELYVIYTGRRKDVPNQLCLSELYDGLGSVEVKVKVLSGAGTMDIVDQYVRFCRIADENRQKFGFTQQAVEETICQCIRENILEPFLAGRQKEVLEIMAFLFDQETISQIHDYNLIEEARQEGHQEGHQEGRQEGWQEGRQEERENSMQMMVSTLKEFIPDRDAVVERIAQQFHLLPQIAAEKVNLYWKQ